MSREHHYEVNVRWTGNTGAGTAKYLEYGRDHEVSAAGKPRLLGTADPAFLGTADRWNPEELLVASLSQCHMLTYLALCARDRIVVYSYEDNATGVMTEERGNSGRFAEVVLNPTVVITDLEQIDRATELHHQANQTCFIAKSVNFPVRHRPIVRAD
ncbi:OsmC family protein [Glycomyces buryatensis]|uniref:OsmC family peroxiredoxin n=1 Tax=Glycomyces buryatensis TaxID=2570927 RepID=A0A4S8QEK4_9ACTN|nr:OsmC family protein [Glycomyces buryatensis]THV42770.1 OsmC family peroxiredoxin [Glycomyces buryatensis]